MLGQERNYRWLWDNVNHLAIIIDHWYSMNGRFGQIFAHSPKRFIIFDRLEGISSGKIWKLKIKNMPNSQVQVTPSTGTLNNLTPWSKIVSRLFGAEEFWSSSIKTTKETKSLMSRNPVYVFVETSYTGAERIFFSTKILQMRKSSKEKTDLKTFVWSQRAFDDDYFFGSWKWIDQSIRQKLFGSRKFRHDQKSKGRSETTTIECQQRPESSKPRRGADLKSHLV